jgi:hypothetical protein
MMPPSVGQNRVDAGELDAGVVTAAAGENASNRGQLAGMVEQQSKKIPWMLD